MKHATFPLHMHPRLHVADVWPIVLMFLMLLVVIGVLWLARNLPATPTSEAESGPQPTFPTPSAPW